MKRWPLHRAYFWETAPFFRVLAPFATGILVYDLGPFREPAGWLWTVDAALFILLAVFALSKNNGIFSRVFQFSLFTVTLFMMGLTASSLFDARNDASWFGNNIHKHGKYLLRITDAPPEKEHSWKLPADVLASVDNGNASVVYGKTFLYVYKDEMPALRKGDSILVPGNWQVIKNPGNPFEFDYATYCRRNNIVYQQICRGADIRLFAASNPGHAPVIERAHDWCMAQLDKYLPDHKTKGLMQAMLLGDEVNLDEDLIQSYSETGIVHIIAISGGNVTIFFIIISVLLWWLRHKKHLWIKYAVALPLVWFYVMMAGAAPSAIRAAIMFSLLAFAVLLQKNNNSLNTLFATAFLLLCAQPMWLFSVGFQLSFVAVLSLILFYAPIHRWLSPPGVVLQALWSTVAASMAAEVLVAPLVVYYFHTFPLLFIVANVIAYLFMGLVLVLGITIIALSWFPVAATWVGICTTWLVTVFDRLVVWLQGLNPESFHYLLLTGLELVLLYFVIGGVVLFLMQKKKRALFTAMTALCLLFISFCLNEWTRLHRQTIIAFNTGGSSHVELIAGNLYTRLAADTANIRKIDYTSKPVHVWLEAWVKDTIVKNEVFAVGGKRVLLLNQPFHTSQKFPVDYLIITYTGKINIHDLQKAFSPRVIVFGNNYPRKQQEKYKKMAGNVHATGIDGALTIN